MAAYDVSRWRLILLVVVSLVCGSFAAPFRSASPGIIADDNFGDDSKDTQNPDLPVEMKVGEMDDINASKDLGALAEEEDDDVDDEYEGYDDLYYDTNHDDDDNDEIVDDEDDDDDFEAENTLLGEQSTKNNGLYHKEFLDENRPKNKQLIKDAIAVLDEEEKAIENPMKWRTHTPHTPPIDDALMENADFASDAESSELRELKRSDDLDRENEVKDIYGYPKIRVIELNETLYLNDTGPDQPDFQPVPIPESFEDYDVNRNGWISLQELRYVTGATEGAVDAFRAVDINGDGRIDRDEFKATHWGTGPEESDQEPPPSGVVLMPAEELKPSSNPRSADGPKTP